MRGTAGSARAGIATAGLAVTVLLGGCGHSLKDENAHLREENGQLRAELADAVAQRDAADLRARDAEQRAAQLVTPRQAQAQAPAAAGPTAGSGSGAYVVQRGDTLSHIALKFYKDATRWPEIHEANRSVIGDNPARLAVGMKLTIP